MAEKLEERRKAPLSSAAKAHNVLASDTQPTPVQQASYSHLVSKMAY
jgi:hypothetical protein